MKLRIKLFPLSLLHPPLFFYLNQTASSSFLMSGSCQDFHLLSDSLKPSNWKLLDFHFLSDIFQPLYWKLLDSV